MADQGQYQQQQQEQAQQRARQQQKQAEEAAPPASRSVHATEQRAGGLTGKAPGFKAQPAKATLGRAAARTIGIEWIPAPIPWPQGGTAQSVRFRVTTTAGAVIEARLEQLAYNRTESGQGGLTTQIVPAAPIGTRGKLTVRDPATGETVEQPWTWINLGGGWSLWGFIKRLIWPGK